MSAGSPDFVAASTAKRVQRGCAERSCIKYFWRQDLSDGCPAWMRSLLGPACCYLDMLFLDHGVLRLIYVNQHRLGGRAWRSGQPAPHHIDALARSGLRTIVNLRGTRPCGSYLLEKKACDRLGIILIDFKIRSRLAPAREEIKAAADLFQRIEYPVLLHCKSGADRAGFMSVLYRFLAEDVSLLEAKRQLSLRYGHLRQSATGVLDYFFERYISDNDISPIPFLDWVDHVYDPDELQRSFRGRGNR
jgi:protein tyrosine phosphatase (PTP) superfamily phosphohydrolase (DUF442 family)